MTTVREANRMRLCLDCGEPGANLLTDRSDRILRICNACLRKDDWHRFGLRDREPILGEVPTEYVEGEWIWPEAEGPEPAAVIMSRATGHAGWLWWALGKIGGGGDLRGCACRGRGRGAPEGRTVTTFDRIYLPVLLAVLVVVGGAGSWASCLADRGPGTVDGWVTVTAAGWVGGLWGLATWWCARLTPEDVDDETRPFDEHLCCDAAGETLADVWPRKEEEQ